MNHPKSIKIGPFIFSISYTSNLWDEGKKLDGQVDQWKSDIKIESELGFQARMQTILHEALHIVFLQSGMPFVKDTILDAVATKIYGIIRENKDLIRTMMKDKE